MTRNLNRLGKPIFLFSLTILILNDWFFKTAFHNFITGKLSDFAGLFAFPFFWSVLFPKKTKEIHLGIVLFFIFWKSHFSDAFVDFTETYRVVDFSDNIALISVFISFRSLKKEHSVLKLNPIFLSLILLISCFSFIATTQKPRFEDVKENIQLVLNNETNQKLIVLIDFKFSEKEIDVYKKQGILQTIEMYKEINKDDKRYVFNKTDSISIINSINEQWNTIKKKSVIEPLVLDIHQSATVELPLTYYDKQIGFPENFKISVLDTTRKTIKTYNKKTFFEKINQNSSVKLNEFLRENSLNLTFGEVTKPLILSDFYGKWESKIKGNFNKIEFNSKYFSNDKTGAVYDCEYKNDTILVHTPEKVHIGVIKNPKDDVLVISWDTKTVVTYKRSSKPTSLGNQ
ncbi:hypothetical protein [Flavobacterium branchiicola]|uniref:Uncharacterized protein n=1 Tax=Flavobacterium branchiicola TaxID=1114875 RepID=A0ABV9PFJ0_9FLAO|nr:hypothetical protein [Flavobacterium branchiicola]MBS7255309.1 hypothetical protein [Flavobacterium branchiicola]